VISGGVGRLVISPSPSRGLEFGTRKITWHAAAIKKRLPKELRLGQPRRRTDWGYAKDYGRGEGDAPARHTGGLRDRDGRGAIECASAARGLTTRRGLGELRAVVVIDLRSCGGRGDHLIGNPGKRSAI